MILKFILVIRGIECLITLNLCHTCGRANHNQNKCNNTPKCLICAASELKKSCKDLVKECLNPSVN